MNMTIHNGGEQPIYAQIKAQIKEQILSGVLREGEMLPSMRTLARELRISVITTKRAYEELEREGFITTMTGRGSFVAPLDRNFLREEMLRRAEEALRSAVSEARAGGITRTQLFEMLRLICEEELS